VTLVDAGLRVALGLAIGSFGTLIGAGGGFLLVPLLVLGYHFSPATAVGTSLSLVFLNAASGSAAYLRQRRVDLALAWKLAAATVPGAIGGAYLNRLLSSVTFHLLFGVVLVALAAFLLSGISVAPSQRANRRRLLDAGGEAHAYHVDEWKGVVVSFVVGFLSSVLGIGGGIIHVPFLIVALSLPVHVATATSHFILAMTALAGVIAHFYLGHVLTYHAIALGIGAALGAQIGAKIAHRTKSKMLLRALSIALAVVGARLLFR